MTQAYRLLKPEMDLDSYICRYLIVGRATFEVPSVRCRACGGARDWAPRYPAFDVTKLDEETKAILRHHESRGDRAATPERFEELRARLAHALGPDSALRPLTDLGPLQGEAKGRFDDFSWADCWHILFIRESTYRALRTAGFALTGVPAAVRYRRQRRDPLIEIEALPAVRLHPSCRPEPCESCGFTELSNRTDGVAIDAASFDPSIPLQCIRERPNILIVNEAFADHIREQGLSGAELRPWTFK